MTKLMTIYYSKKTEEAYVKPAKDWFEIHPVIRADCLADALHDLEQLYNGTLFEMRASERKTK